MARALNFKSGSTMADRAENRDQAPRAWQRMLSGRRLDLLAPSPGDIEISDIAHGLARVARWNGQTVGAHAFSVAQHSIVVADIVAALMPSGGRTLLRAALLHDAPEYVLGDLISPFKATIGNDYRATEERLQRAVHRRFALPETLPDDMRRIIKLADRISAFHEATALAGFSPAEAQEIFGTPPELPPALARQLGVLEALATRQAQAKFLDCFEKFMASVEFE